MSDNKKRYQLSIGMLLALIGLLSTTPVFAQDESQLFEGTPVGITEDGYPYRGSPDAELTLIEYSDYLCPFCARHFSSTNQALVDQYVKAGKMRLEFRDFPIPKLHPTAAVGHAASGCAARQGAVQFWTMHHAIFERQREWSRLPEPQAFLRSVAEDVGLDLAKYDTCIGDSTEQARVEAAIKQGQEIGFNATPSFQLVDSKKTDEPHQVVGARPIEYFSKYVDALLAGTEPPEEPTAPKPELPQWAKPESLIPDPEHAGFTTGGDPYRGSADALLVIVEFTDYQCPSCKNHARDTQPEVDRRLIDTGMVRWVTKHLPLREHPNAAAAATAAECAGDQNKFYDMHDSLFEEQESWAALESPDSALMTIAAKIGLDLAQFGPCLNSRQALERVLPDMYDAAGVTRNTPTFVVLDGETGRSIRGALDPEEFISRVERVYKEVEEREAQSKKEKSEKEDDSASETAEVKTE